MGHPLFQTWHNFQWQVFASQSNSCSKTWHCEFTPCKLYACSVPWSPMNLHDLWSHTFKWTWPCQTCRVNISLLNSASLSSHSKSLTQKCHLQYFSHFTSCHSVVTLTKKHKLTHNTKIFCKKLKLFIVPADEIEWPWSRILQQQKLSLLYQFLCT